MDLPGQLVAQLDSLTDSLGGDGTDLHAILAVLVDDLTEAVPSFTGLTVTIQVDGTPVTFTALDPQAQVTSRSSILLPTVTGDGGNYLVFYASNPDAFTELAADTRSLFGLDGEVIVDGHLPAPALLDGLAELTEINQAIGVLMATGHSPAEATAALDRRSGEAGATRAQTAREILRRAAAEPED